MVVSMSATNEPSQNLRMKLDLPTPLSPIRMILKMWSYVTCELLPSAVAITGGGRGREGEGGRGREREGEGEGGRERKGV